MGEGVEQMAVQMRTMLGVADNSGARKLQMILPLGGASGKRAGLGDVVTASVKEASPDGQVKKGKGCENGDCAHSQRIRTPRRHLYPFRRECCGIDQRSWRAGRNPRFRPSGPRTAR